MSSVPARPSCSGGFVFVLGEKSERKNGISFFPLLAFNQPRGVKGECGRFPLVKPFNF